MEMGGRYRVLVVDDYAHCAEAIAVVVGLHGHEPKAVTTGRAAIDACRSFAPDLVLLDLGLPDMCGYEAVRILKACRPSVRIVAITGWPDATGLIRAYAAGVEQYIEKPFTRRRIESVLSSMCTGVTSPSRILGVRSDPNS